MLTFLESSKQGKTSQQVNKLLSFAEKGAETDHAVLIYKLFNSSAGRLLFSTSKHGSPSLHETALANGNETVEVLLLEIFERCIYV